MKKHYQIKNAVRESLQNNDGKAPKEGSFTEKIFFDIQSQKKIKNWYIKLILYRPLLQ